jgi:hypothetical protein
MNDKEKKELDKKLEEQIAKIKTANEQITKILEENDLMFDVAHVVRVLPKQK